MEKTRGVAEMTATIQCYFFLLSLGLRKTMLRAHRQAWAWQDEYFGLTIDDIRLLEQETQEALKAKMTALLQGEEGEGDKDEHPHSPKKEITEMPCPPLEDTVLQNGTAERSGMDKIPSRISMVSQESGRRQSWGSARSRISGASARNLAEWRVESLEQLRTSSSDDEEFYDASGEITGIHFENLTFCSLQKNANCFLKLVFLHLTEDLDAYVKSHPSLFKSSSMEMLNDDMLDGVAIGSPSLSRQSTGGSLIQILNFLRRS